MLITLFGVGLGFALGFLGAHATALGWWTLLPWAVGGIVVGYLANRRAALAGACYGFVLSFTFMVGVYTGTASVLSRTPFFALLGVVGAICGSILAISAARFRRRGAPEASRPVETR